MLRTAAESGINSYSKIVPYIAQYQARAHESHAFLVQSNVGATFDTANAAGAPYGPDNTGLLDAQGGSHGNSLVIAPDGNILLKAPVFGEFAALQDLDMRLARGGGGYTPHKFMVAAPPFSPLASLASLLVLCDAMIAAPPAVSWLLLLLLVTVIHLPTDRCA